MALEVAKEVLRQIGGNMAIRMIGAYNLVGDANSLSFRFKATAKLSMNFCKITLTPMDLYDFELGRVRAGKYTQVYQVSGTYEDQLVKIFEQETGLCLSLNSH